MPAAARIVCGTNPCPRRRISGSWRRIFTSPSATPAWPAASLACSRRVLVQDHRRQLDDGRLRRAEIGFQRRLVRHHIVVEIKDPRLAIGVEGGARQVMRGNRLKQRRGDGMPLRLAVPLAVCHIAPPLQPDFAGQRVVDEIADAVNFGVERIKRKQRRRAWLPAQTALRYSARGSPPGP